MKIISFAVDNFRGISGGLERNIIYFDNSNTLLIFGQNNTGKSAFLHAYEYFFYNTHPSLEDFYLQDPNNKISFELEVELSDADKGILEQKSKKASYMFQNYLSKDGRLKMQKIWGSEDVKTKSKTYKETNRTFSPKTSDWDDKYYGGIGLHEVFQESLPKPIHIKAMPTEEETEKIVNQILAIRAEEFLKDAANQKYKDAIEAIKELKEKMYDPERIQQYKTHVNEQFQKLFSDTQIELDPKEKKNNLTMSIVGRDYGVKFYRLNSDKGINEAIPSSYHKIGHGAIRTAIFTLFLMRDIAEGYERKMGRKNYLVLFEEPELFLHPKLIKILRSLIYQISQDDLPFQILCASHSPQMIDITKSKSSLIRMTKTDGKTRLFQIDETILMDKAKMEVKHELYEALRFNPYICESFYADEIILVEGDSEAVILRAFLQTAKTSKDIFVLNCGTVNNIPFFQKIFSKFNIKYHVFCDTDGRFNGKFDQNKQPIFEKFIQGKIYEQINEDVKKTGYRVGILRVHDKNFEEAHRLIGSNLKYPFSDDEIKQDGKPFCANRYWDDVLKPNLGRSEIDNVPIIKYLKEMLAH